ncbi:MAG: multidrug effflux MFS transporter [Verrucomicrobiota bacterium]|nr:multidrug effflux MFS transporter [Verrucomicrobiota bacterium]
MNASSVHGRDTADGTLIVPRSLPLLIAALSMIGPFAIDTYLPSFREIETSLGASALEVQQSLTAYLVPFAFMSLWHGSISDALGRRRIILVALLLLALTSVGCALAPTIRVLWIFRALQGFASGAGLVVGRAVVRDVYEGAAAQRVMAQVTMIFTIAPAIAPVLGGWLHEWFGWRSVFYFLALFSLAVWVWCAAKLPETLHPERRHPLNARFLLRSYVRTLTNSRFLAVVVAGALNFTAVFLYITSAPVFLMRHLHLRETQFFWLFGPITFGMLLGAGLSGKFAGRLSPTRTVVLGYAAMLAAATLNVGFHLLRPAQLPWSVAPLFLYTIGMALAMPSIVLFGLDLFPAQKGLAASCQAFLMTSINAITAGLLSPLASVSPLRLALTSAALTGGGLLCIIFFFKKEPGCGASFQLARSLRLQVGNSGYFLRVTGAT